MNRQMCTRRSLGIGRTMANIHTARARLCLNHQHLSAGVVPGSLRLNSTSSVAASTSSYNPPNAAKSTRDFVSSKTPAIQNVTSVDQGKKYTPDYKKYAVDASSNQVISWFHDVPLDLDLTTKEVNMVVEIPRWSNAKFEISTSEVGNPIVQDVKKGSVRFVKNLFPQHGYVHNYGAIPQTWEDPTAHHQGVELFGDNDPIDVCDIGTEVTATGDVKRVKILGSIALIDDGELDWKVIAINVNDPLSKELFDIHDLYVKCPGLLETTRHWFKDYKLPDGKPQNKFAFNGVYKNQAETLDIILGCHGSWKKLINEEIKGKGLPVLENSTLIGTSGFGEFDSKAILANPAQGEAPIPLEVNKSYYLPTD